MKPPIRLVSRSRWKPTAVRSSYSACSIHPGFSGSSSANTRSASPNRYTSDASMWSRMNSRTSARQSWRSASFVHNDLAIAARPRFVDLGCAPARVSTGPRTAGDREFAAPVTYAVPPPESSASLHPLLHPSSRRPSVDNLRRRLSTTTMSSSGGAIKVGKSATFAIRISCLISASRRLCGPSKMALSVRTDTSPRTAPLAPGRTSPACRTVRPPRR